MCVCAINSVCGVDVLEMILCVFLAGYIPVPQYMEKKMKTYPIFNDEDCLIAENVVKSFAPFRPLALP